eukprot:1328853-Amphidinium_carterae.1
MKKERGFVLVGDVVEQDALSLSGTMSRVCFTLPGTDVKRSTRTNCNETSNVRHCIAILFNPQIEETSSAK